MSDRIKYRYVGASDTTYYWERPVLGDSRWETISCPKAWFWASAEPSIGDKP